MIAFRVLLFLFTASVLTGCYTLGDARPSMMRGISSLAVPVSANRTLEPNVEDLLTDTITKELQTDGTYSITYNDRADAIVYTTLVETQRRASRSVRGNVIAASEYVLYTTVEYKVVEAVGGKVLMTGEILGQTSFFVTADLQSDEAQALPLAFSDVAIKLASRLSEGF